MRFAPLSCFLAVLSLGACAEAPFVDTTAEDIRKNSQVVVCFPKSATREQVEAAAATACRDLQKVPKLQSIERMQCRITASSRAQYTCVEPDAPAPRP